MHDHHGAVRVLGVTISIVGAALWKQSPESTSHIPNSSPALSAAALLNATVHLLWAGFDGVPGIGDDYQYTTVADGDGRYSFTHLLRGRSH